MRKLHVSDGQVRGSRAGRPATGSRRTWQPRLERLEARCLPGFLAPLAYDAGIHPSAVAVGDLNGDGIPDLAVANDYYGTVSVLLGQGDGTFLYPQTFPAGINPTSVAVADFNGDGIPDLAVAGFAGTVSVLLGQGDGTFLPAQSYAAWPHATRVAVGDFNGDGFPDLAVASWGTEPFFTDGTVSILLGKGDGTFLPAVSYATGTQANSVAVGDFNGDGKLDLAVANYGDYYGNGSGVTVLLGKGDSTFLPAQTFPAGNTPCSVAVGDFNGDGKQDLAVANLGDPFGNGIGVSALLGKGDGTFLYPQTFPAGINPTSVAVGDFNGDGILDLAVADTGFSGNGSGVSVLLGQGGGTFLPAHSYAAGYNPFSVAVGDFNGDGFPDLAVANPYSNGVSILLNDATWAGGPGRARGGPSHPAVPEPLPPPAVLPFPRGEGPRLGPSVLLSLPPPPGNRPVIEPPASLSLPGADPPRPTILAALLWEGRPSGLTDPRVGPPARGAPGAALDHLFAELAVNGVWDDRTDDGMLLLA
jgi:hypothetical protein